LNDLWKFRVNDSNWIWISGSNTTNQRGIYGEKGIPSADNRPGARSGAVAWFDSEKQQFWLFGGRGYANSTLGSFLTTSSCSQCEKNTMGCHNISFIYQKEEILSQLQSKLRVKCELFFLQFLSYTDGKKDDTNTLH